MTNLLAQAINCADADLVAKMIQDALGTGATTSSTTASRRTGRMIASGAPRRHTGPREPP
jgi:hypothetical protein